MPYRDKRLVAASFSRAAASYDQVAGLQRRIADRLRSWLADERHDLVVDLGSGTGYANSWLSPVARLLVNLDLAEGMLRFAKSQSTQGVFIAGDAEQLPLATDSVDLIWSSLALQWSEQPEQLFNELQRVTRPGARILIATLGPKTLHELRAAWLQADKHQHVNQFSDIDLWLKHAEGFEVVRHEQVDEVEEYQELRQLLRELRDLGAHNVNPERRPGLGGQSSLRAMYAAYEAMRMPNGMLPATYEVHYLELKRR
jgi:malonyl-CoA O-methyltransferase